MLSTIVLYALTVDAAVETFKSGSPVRWWVATAAAIYAAATAVAWNRTAWRAKAVATGLVLAGTLAVSAWLPGGTGDGMRAIGQTTPTLLLAAASAGVALAGFVLWRVQQIPAPVRWAIAVVAAYGVAAFVLGIATGTPFAAVVAGEIVSRALPSILQDAFLASLILLPVAAAVAVVRVGVPRLREGAPRYPFYQCVALATSLAVVVAALPEWARVARAAAIPSSSQRPNLPSPIGGPLSPAQAATLEKSFRAIEDGERESPRDRWDVEYVASQVGPEPQALVDWVRGNTYWIPYRGALRGPVGVLMDRQGGSLDRALLLAALLQATGQPVRLAHGAIPDAQARLILPALVLARTTRPRKTVSDSPADDSNVRAAAEQYHLNTSAILETLKQQAEMSARVTQQVQTREVEQTRLLLGAVPSRGGAPDIGRRLDLAATVLGDHWWVQRQEGDTWIDLDILSLENGKPLAAARETFDLADLPSSVRHEIAIRVVAEQWDGRAVRERTAIEHVFRPADTVGKRIVLQLWPRDWSGVSEADADATRAVREAAIAQRMWNATLVIDAEPVAKATLSDAGEIGEPPEVNPLDEKFADIASKQPPPSRDRAGGKALTAVWLEYEIRTPNEPPRTTRREVFDLIGPAARAAHRSISLTDADRLSRGLSLMMATEILPVVCEIPPEFVLHLAAANLLANRELLVADEARAAELAPQATPPPTPLYGLGAARFDWSRVRDEIYVDRAGILTRHRFLSTASDRIVWRDAVDIIANEVGVDVMAPDPYAVRLEQGVLDTNAEALARPGSSPAMNTGQAFASSRDWVTLATADDVVRAASGLPDDARQRITAEVAAGYVVVAPRAPVALGSDRFVGWWRVDPRTGDALGMDSRGWGGAQALPEYAYLLTFMNAAFTEFVLCSALHEFVGVWRDGADFGASTKANLGACVAQAITAGFIAMFFLLLISAAGTMALRGTSGSGLPPPGVGRGASAVHGPSGPPRGAPPPGSSPPRGSPPPGSSPPRGSPPPGSSPPRGSLPPGSSPPRGSPPPGSSPPVGSPPPGAAPKGPFTPGGPLADFIRENPYTPPGPGEVNWRHFSQEMGGEAGANALNKADDAATNAYNSAVNSGMSDEAAHQVSQDAWKSAWDQYKPNFVGSPAHGEPGLTHDLGKTQPDPGASQPDLARTQPGTPGPSYAPVRGAPPPFSEPPAPANCQLAPCSPPPSSKSGSGMIDFWNFFKR